MLNASHLCVCAQTTSDGLAEHKARIAAAGFGSVDQYIEARRAGATSPPAAAAAAGPIY